MARTTEMKLIELMVLKEDINQVIEFFGKKGNFEFQTELNEGSSGLANPSKEMFDKLQLARAYLNIEDQADYPIGAKLPQDQDFEEAGKLLDAIELMRIQELETSEKVKRVKEAYSEASSFANLKVPYAEFEHLTFLTLRIGKIDPSVIDELVFNIGERAVIIPLGEDKSKIMAATSKKGRFALDTELKKFGFVPLEIAKDFKGVPDDVLENLKHEYEEAKNELDQKIQIRINYGKEHTQE